MYYVFRIDVINMARCIQGVQGLGVLFVHQTYFLVKEVEIELYIFRVRATSAFSRYFAGQFGKAPYAKEITFFLD